MRECLHKSVRYAQGLSLTGLLLFGLTACCQPCLKPVLLPNETHPIMREVVTNDVGGLDEPQLINLLENLTLYQGALDKCNTIINNYNMTVR